MRAPPSTDPETAIVGSEASLAPIRGEYIYIRVPNSTGSGSASSGSAANRDVYTQALALHYDEWRAHWIRGEKAADLATVDPAYVQTSSCLIHCFKGQNWYGVGIASTKTTRRRLAMLSLAIQMEEVEFGGGFVPGALAAYNAMMGVTEKLRTAL